VSRRVWAVAASATLFAVVVVLLVWRGPDWSAVADAFTVVAWWWIGAAIALNVLSVLARCLSWHVVITQAMPRPHPRFRQTFSSFSVGLLGNAVLPGRMGELARVAALRRRLPRRERWTATLAGTVFAHRLFDLVPAVLLVFYVLATARIPHWAVTSLLVAAALGMALLAVGLVGARSGKRELELSAVGPLVRLLEMARRGLGVLRAPVPAALAAFLQCVGWFVQLLAVWAAMRPFDIHAPLPAAGLVLLLMNVATIFPLWPGNIGLLQAAVALPLGSYGVAYATGFAYGLVLQVVEMSVGVGIGLAFLAREGMSLASLRRMEHEQADGATATRAATAAADRPSDARGVQARVPG